MREISAELRERLEEQRGENAPRLPISSFVWVGWPLNTNGETTATRCYSTMDVAVTMDGKLYDGKNRLLDFNEKDDRRPFVMGNDHLYYGASCGFRVFDAEGLVDKLVTAANTRREFPAIYCEAWLHFSEDAREIESLRFGKMVFGGHVTRIELQEDTNGRNIAKVWGGYEGLMASKLRPYTATTASVVV